MKISSSDTELVEVEKDVMTVCCRGVDDALGHPAVYLTFSDSDTVQCYYCGRVFKRTSMRIENN